MLSHPSVMTTSDSYQITPSLLNILALPEIVNVIDRYINDNDKIRLLSTCKSAMGSSGFVINKIFSITVIHKFWLFDSKTKICLNIHSWYDNIPINDNVFFVEFRPHSDECIEDCRFFYGNVNIDKIYVGSKHTHITHVKFDYYFDQSIEKKMLDSIKYLEFGEMYSFPINKEYLPSNLTHLVLKSILFEPVPISLPDSLTHLTIQSWVNWESIKKLHRRTTVDSFPSKLTHLTFSNGFYPLSDIGIPRTITHLSLGRQFYCSLRGQIPPSVIHLTLPANFPIEYIVDIPTTVKYISYM